MIRLSAVIVSFLIVLSSCQHNKTRFKHDPSFPYPLLNPGDFWVDKFDQRGLQNAIVYRDYIYCNTIDVGGDGNYLYCLNPRNGLVVWRGQVKAYATQPASFTKGKVVYVSYLGDITTFDSTGNMLWNARFGHPFGGHWLDTNRERLLVKTIHGKNVAEYDVHTGHLISDTENDSLQRLIESKRKEVRLLEKHQYQFTRNGKTYTLTCRPSKQNEVGEYTIDIER